MEIISDKLVKAQQALNQNDKKRAIGFLKEELNSNPTNVVAWLMIAQSFEDIRLKIASYRQVLRFDPRNISAQNGLRELTTATSRTDGALIPPEPVNQDLIQQAPSKLTLPSNELNSAQIKTPSISPTATDQPTVVSASAENWRRMTPNPVGDTQPVRIKPTLTADSPTDAQTETPSVSSTVTDQPTVVSASAENWRRMTPNPVEDTKPVRIKQTLPADEPNCAQIDTPIFSPIVSIKSKEVSASAEILPKITQNLDEDISPVRTQPKVSKTRPKPQRHIEKEKQSRAPVDFPRMWSYILFLSESGSLVVPIILIGTLFLSFLIDLAVKFNSNFFIGLVLVPIAFAALFFLIPWVGTLIVALVRILIIVGVLGGKIVGIGLGLVCALFYLLTLWAPVGVSYAVCTITGLGFGFLVAKLSESLLSFSGFWYFLNYALLILAGAIGGWLFVNVAENGAAAQAEGEKGISLDDISLSLKKPARAISRIVNAGERISMTGERYK